MNDNTNTGNPFNGPTDGNDDAHRERIQALIGDDYRLQWVIGHGGMSTVWLADDVRQDREVAIKALRPEFSNNTEFLERFRNEAEAAEHIDSDNVVRTYDYREVPDPNGTVFCFIVMEFVRGESLADLLAREGALSEDMALDVLEQAAHGLAVIHSMGLVHRDIKPGNLLVTQSGQVKITDFGIAKAAAAVPLTRTGMVVGTAQYVSPEQAQGQEVYATSDVYSLGVVGYEMLSGKRPFSGDSSVSVVLAHINQAPPQLPTAVSAPTRELIGIGLRKDPATRYADGSEFANAISRVRLGARPPQPHTAAVAGPAPEPSPTSATVALGNVANPPTTHVPQPPEPEPVYEEEPAEEEKGHGFGLGLAIAGAVVILAVVGYALYAMDFFGDGDSASSSSAVATSEDVEPTPEVVTQYITETQATTIMETPSSSAAPTSEEEEPAEEVTREPEETPDPEVPAEDPDNPGEVADAIVSGAQDAIDDLTNGGR